MSSATTTAAGVTAFSNTTTPTTSTTLLPPAASLLDQLLENTKSLPRNVTGLGAIQLGVSEISSQTRILRDKATPSADGDTKAHYLLAGSGINAEDIAHDLETVTLPTALETTAPSTTETDIAGYLRYKREENIIASIEDSVKQTARKFDAFVSANIRLDWNYEKLLVCEHFGLVPRGTANKLGAELGIAGHGTGSGTHQLPLSGAEATPGRTRVPSATTAAGWKKSSLGRSVLGPVSGALEFSDVGGVDTAIQQQQMGLQLQSRQQRYAAIIAILNNCRLEHRSMPLIPEMAEVSKSFGTDTRTLQLSDSWLILGSVIPPETPERRFASVYCESAEDSPESIHMKKLIVQGSRRYLEKQFFNIVENDIAKYPQEAQLGGIPSVENKILAYLKLRFLKNGAWMKQNLQIVNNVPIWALIFYLFRSGHLQEALDYTVQNEGYFQKIERTFPIYLKVYVKSGDERRLPGDLAERLQTEFNHHIRVYDPKTDDPYKYALYKLIGRCELSRKNIPEVLLIAEDWMWAQLMMTQDSSSATTDVFGISAAERYTLSDLRNMLVQFGARHFNPRGNNPGVYFQVLLLSGQYERAIHYIYKYQPVDAVHFAIGLAYYGLLRVSADTTSLDADLLTVDTQGRPEINFARLLGYYTRDFRRTDPEIAVDYLSLICLCGDLKIGDKGLQYLRLCHEALRELVLETRDFAVLLGDVRADGTRAPGIIERKMELIKITDEQEYLRMITEQAAEQADQDGRTADAVLLYHLSEEYDVVVAIVNKTLGESLAIADLSSDEVGAGVSMSLAAAEDPVQLARNMMAVYSNNSEILRKVTAKNREACAMLLHIVEARRAYEDGRWEECLECIANVNVLPMELTNDTGSIRRRAQQFGGLDESVARNVPMLLVMAMESCVRITRDMDASAYGDATRSKKIGELRTRAKNCMIYAGMIQYRMPREVYGRLTRMETEL
ncbi:Nup93/Nic96-domain-containing protein [Lipomyces tetrasporus]|uniref:Nuclear pore protein n=1 Tax=Lipomyces tetrasporus TaxID=54092 RepID=A0AAD7QSJ2_9ASCO|nr:Nup93/Nic96-domain-containing protein [Lipomyces tetrasporus]KAJ8100619.1 Nup93/Nic96-domain-containing protein [Lipomyces tetrasporus]